MSQFSFENKRFALILFIEKVAFSSHAHHFHHGDDGLSATLVAQNDKKISEIFSLIKTNQKSFARYSFKRLEQYSQLRRLQEIY